MNRLRLFGLVAVAMLALSVAVVAPAFALETTWLVNGVKPAATVKTDSSGVNFLLEDKKLADIVCATVTDKGTVGPGAEDKVTSVTFTGCKTSTGSNCTVTAKALPWTTLLVLLGTEFSDEALNAGYISTCTVFGVEVKDECELAGAGFIDISNLAGGIVDAEFLAVEEGLCSSGGKAIAVGLEEVLTESGEPLAASEC